jgi:hypothetical protein
MEKLVINGKKEIRLLLVESLHQTVQALGISKSKKKTERTINKSAKKIAELVADQMRKELKKIRSAKVKNNGAPKTKKKKSKKIKESDLEIA